MIKSLVIRLFSAFSRPPHIEQEDPIPIEHKTKGWNIKLSAPTMTEKVNAANKIKPLVMKESEEHLKRNEEPMKAFLAIFPKDGHVGHFNNFYSDKKWRVKE